MCNERVDVIGGASVGVLDADTLDCKIRDLPTDRVAKMSYNALLQHGHLVHIAIDRIRIRIFSKIGG